MASQSILSDSKLVYRSRAFLEVMRRAETAAQCGDRLLLRGPSGTGKTVLARLIHDLGPRRDLPFLHWSVPQTASSLAKAELLGSVKGAYTGADHDSVGVVEKAGKGTLFFDEIDKAPSEVQESLLRILDDRSFWRMGSTTTRVAEARFIFATNRDLQALADQGQFMPELLNRLNVLTIDIPPLRERLDDIPPLVTHFAREAASEAKCDVPRFSAKAMEHLVAHFWPGNIRELAGVVLNLVVWGGGKLRIGEDEVARILGRKGAVAGGSDLSNLRNLPAWERKTPKVILKALHLTDGRGAEAARALGIGLSTFRRLQREHSLRRCDLEGKPDLVD